MSDEKKKDSSGGKGSEGRSWRGRRHGNNAQSAGTKKNPEDVPLLRFGNNNNFHKFSEALSKVALREYGHLGKLIELEKYYEAKMPTRESLGLTADTDENKLLFHEAIKAHLKLNNDMVMNQPKLYGLIWQYLSAESMDEVKHHKDYKQFSDDKDPEGLWKAVIDTHKVHSISRIGVVKKLLARKEYKGMRQGGYEALVSYRERYDAALKTYMHQGNLKIDMKTRQWTFSMAWTIHAMLNSRLISTTP
jgi:hypothetical protein